MLGSRRQRWIVFAVGMLFLVLAVALTIRGSSRPEIAHHSAASLAVALYLLIWATISLWFSFAPLSIWESLLAMRSPQSQATTSVPVWATILLAAAILGCQAGVTIHYFGINNRANDDEADYLRVAKQVADTGGIPGMIRGLFAGDFQESNRHPLYLVLLAMKPDFFAGKVWSALFGMLGTGILLIFGIRQRGAIVGLLSAALLAGCQAWMVSSTIVACETLFACLVLLAYFLIREPKDLNRPLSFVVGILMGLAYLTKASAFFLAIIGVVFLGFYSKKRTASLLFFVGFLLAASPLFYRNAIVFKNPLHSVNNQFLFVDTFEEGLLQEDLGTVGNMKRYFAEPGSLSKAVRRLFKGLAYETWTLCRLPGPIPFDSLRVLPGMTLLGVLLLESLRAPTFDAGRCLLTGWLVFFWLFFGWYSPIAASDRFLVPLLPPLLFEISTAIERLSHRFASPQKCRTGIVLGIVSYLLFTTSLGLATSG